VIIVLAGGEDGTALEMAFSRKKIEERKAWLRSFVPGTYLDHTASDITYTDFVNKVCYKSRQPSCQMVLHAVGSAAQSKVSCHPAAYQSLVCQSDAYHFSSLVSFTCLPFLVSFTFPADICFGQQL